MKPKLSTEHAVIPDIQALKQTKDSSYGDGYDFDIGAGCFDLSGPEM